MTRGGTQGTVLKKTEGLGSVDPGADVNPKEGQIQQSAGASCELQLGKRKKIPQLSFIHRTFPSEPRVERGPVPTLDHSVLVPSCPKRSNPHLVFTYSIV